LDESIIQKIKFLLKDEKRLIGSNLIIALSQLVGDSGRIVVLDNLSSIKVPDPWNVTPLPNIMFVKGDVRSDIDLKRVFKEDPEIVFILLLFLQIKIP